MTNGREADKTSGQGGPGTDLFEPETPWVFGLTVLVGLGLGWLGVFGGLSVGSGVLLGVIGGGVIAGALRPIVRLALRLVERRALEKAYSRRCGRRS